ncbi:MAG: hypothetical protein K2Y29_00750 [Beijerinckiaceae bacterium]|nr:hypothetical protein [Beijerinckiaceae bacterium]
MDARATGLCLALAANFAAGAAVAQQIPSTPGQIQPYVDPNNPPFQLPPGPTDPLDRLYPGPLRPDPIPDTQTPVGRQFPRGETPRPQNSLPQGFTMTIETAGLAMAPDVLTRPRQIGEHLAACWEPPGAGSEVSVRVSFNSAGAVIGVPRVTYVKAGQGADRAAVTGSLERAFARCLPLRFTRDLGSAIAGRPFAFRFIAPGAARP